ncbi:hypothetical protein DPMN_183411 [Dreissena polymorpha]|uniref:Uncharacterized protein n=1 Tax=Dreissena polymorpha TaxID=45954 RepID=A0A9D4DFY2_DREPO|nr:hypothetical protein DPMN_183411 [Dreissena polymorpha]
MQNQSIFVSSSTQLVTSLNIAQRQLHYEVPATRNTQVVAFPTHFDFAREDLFLGETVNISQLNVYYGDGQVEK